MGPAAPSKRAQQDQSSFAEELLQRAHSPATAGALHAEKVKRKPLVLHAPSQPAPPLPTPNSAAPSSTPVAVAGRRKPPGKDDARAVRRAQRNARLEARGLRRPSHRRPQPLSAAEKRRLCVYEMPKAERRYALYVGMHRLWCQYMREVLGVVPEDAETTVAAMEGCDDGVQAGEDRREKERRTQKQTGKKNFQITPQVAGPLIVSADFHGAEIEVVRSRSISRVGIKGIVVRDTKFTFEVVTPRDELKILPKEHTVFRLEVPLVEYGATNMSDEDWNSARGRAEDDRALVFELQGEQFKVRATDRANKKFKVHIPPDL